MNPGNSRFSGGFAVFDFETTGISPAHGHRAVQVAVVSLSPEGDVEGEWQSLINPGRPMAATHVHGLTDADVKNAPPFGVVWSELKSQFADRVVVAHNASFDLRFLQAELRLINELENLSPFHVFDTLRLAHLVEGAVNRRLRSLAAALGVDPLMKPGRGPHDALTDSHVAADVLRHYLSTRPDLVEAGVRVFPRDFGFRGTPGSRRTAPRFL